MKYTRIMSAVLSAMMLAPSAPITTTEDNSAITTATATPTAICESAATPEKEFTMTDTPVQEEAVIADPTTKEELAPPIAIDVPEEEPKFDIGPAICAYFVKPGDMKMFGHTQLGFEHYCKVTETADGSNITLSGWSIGTGDWTYSMLADGTPNAYKGTLPFVVNTGEAFLAPPLAASKTEFELAGFTIEASEENMVSYYPAVGGYYLYGDNWEAAIVDYTRYSEIKYGHQNGNLPDSCKLKYVTNDGKNWVVTSEGAPVIKVKDAQSETETTDPIYAQVENAVYSRNGITDAKYGAVNWGQAVEECGNGTSIYNISGNLKGTDFTVEIDAADSIGFADEYNWTAAIVPSNAVTQHNPSVLHINGYTINVDATGSAYIYNDATSVGREVDCGIANDEVVLVTISDGKHATIATFDVALLGLIWTLA